MVAHLISIPTPNAGSGKNPHKIREISSKSDMASYAAVANAVNQ